MNDDQEDLFQQVEDFHLKIQFPYSNPENKLSLSSSITLSLQTQPIAPFHITILRREVGSVDKGLQAIHHYNPAYYQYLISTINYETTIPFSSRGEVKSISQSNQPTSKSN